MSIPIRSLNISPNGRRQVYLCDGCGRREMLREGKHWCGCNPNAPFKMVSASVRDMSTEAVRAFTTAIHRAKGK